MSDEDDQQQDRLEREVEITALPIDQTNHVPHGTSCGCRRCGYVMVERCLREALAQLYTDPAHDPDAPEEGAGRGPSEGSEDCRG
jgi:hypothetical protein